MYASALAELGYSAVAAIVNAADYGVPQTRRRAVLIASLDHEVALPEPTHAEGGAGGLPPWVPMAAVPELAPFVAGADLMPGTYAYRADGNRRRYAADLEPAPTVAFGHDSAAWQWVLNTGRDWKPGGSRDDAQTIPLDQPAPTVAGAGSQWQWRMPGEAAVRVTVAEAGVLQTFPADYPWTGPSHARYQQVGNAVPPRLAAHLVAAAAGLEPPTFPEEDRPS